MTATAAARDLVREHLLALHIGSEVTRWFRKDRQPNVLDVTPENVIAALHRAAIRPVLMGTHGINVYRDEARATQDVDVLVTRRQLRKAIHVLEEEFPYLEIDDRPVVARFRDPVTQKVVLDVIKPVSQGMRVVFRNTVAIENTHRIPTLEMAVVSKYMAMTAPNRRRDKRLLDAADITNMVDQNRARLKIQRLAQLADASSPGTGKKIRQLIADLDAGHTIHLD